MSHNHTTIPSVLPHGRNLDTRTSLHHRHIAPLSKGVPGHVVRGVQASVECVGVVGIPAGHVVIIIIILLLVY